MAHVGGVVATPDIDEDLSCAAFDDGFGADGVRPEAVDPPGLQLAGRKYPERHIAAARRGLVHDQFEITAGYDSGTDGHLLQRMKGSPTGGAQAQPLDRAEISLPSGKVGAHYQQPWRFLRERDDDLGTFPSWELRQ